MKINFVQQSIIVSIVFSWLACGSEKTQIDSKFKSYINKEYLKSKTEFPKEFVNQFPDTISSELNRLSTNYSLESNSVYFFLYEYDKSPLEIDSITKDISNQAIGQYLATDTCLVVISEEKRPYSDRINLNERCNSNKYPVPYFYHEKDDTYKRFSTKLNESFKIYILAADTMDIFGFNMKKNESIKDTNWGNGYSMGVAVSRQEGTIIYWSIAW